MLIVIEIAPGRKRIDLGWRIAGNAWQTHRVGLVSFTKASNDFLRCPTL